MSLPTNFNLKLLSLGVLYWETLDFCLMGANDIYTRKLMQSQASYCKKGEY